MFNNFYPKIYAIWSVVTSIFIIVRSYVTYPDAVEVPEFGSALLTQFIALLALFVISTILLVLFLVPLTCAAKYCGSMEGLGLGFGTFDYDEVVEHG